MLAILLHSADLFYITVLRYIYVYDATLLVKDHKSCRLPIIKCFYYHNLNIRSIVVKNN